MKIIIYFLTIIISEQIFCQNKIETNQILFNHQVSSERYISDSNGKLRINVNIWGHVNAPGNHLVFDGIDIITLFSIVGGPKIGANLSKIKIIREIDDGDGKLVHIIDLNDFMSTGDRSNFIKIKPNDTILIPQKLSDIILNKVNSLNTLLGVLTLYLQIKDGI